MGGRKRNGATTNDVAGRIFRINSKAEKQNQKNKKRKRALVPYLN